MIDIYLKEGSEFISTLAVNLSKKKTNYSTYFSTMIYKSYLSEYISNNSSLKEGLSLDDKLSAISKEDELVVIKYLLDVMMSHDIITKEEYNAVLYKYS